MLVSPVVRMLGAAPLRERGAQRAQHPLDTRGRQRRDLQERFTIVSFTRVGSGQPSE